MSLIEAIDALFAYVDSQPNSPDYGDRLENEFNPLDAAVWAAARKLGLTEPDLPRKDATFHDPEIVFFGRTNVPGCWSIKPDEPTTLTMMSTQGWRADMAALRKLGEQIATQGDDPKQEAETHPPIELPTLSREPTLSRDEVDILRALKEMHPRLQMQTDIEASTRISRKTIGNCLKRLREQSLVHRPNGLRGGECLTEEGKQVAEHLISKCTR